MDAIIDFVDAIHRVSEPAVMVIAGVISVVLLVKEHKGIYRRKGENLREMVAREERVETLLAKCKVSN